MKVKIKLSFLLFLAVTTYGCTNNTSLSIEPISKKFNELFITGEPLNKYYFSTKEVFQYYQVSNFENLPAKDLVRKLTHFADTNYQLSQKHSIQQLTVYFYKKTPVCRLQQ